MQARLPHRLHKERVASIGNRIATQVQGLRARVHICKRHQVLTVGADVRNIMVNCAAISIDCPLQRIARCRRRNREAVVDAGLDLRRFFVIIPGHELQGGQLVPCVVETVDFRKCLQPRLPALLSHDAVGSP